jgi:membrane protein required for colicin V production
VTAFDYAAGILLLASGLTGLARGATREVTTAVALVVGAIVSVYALRVTGPLARHTVHPSWLANTTAILVMFIVVYTIVRLIGGSLTKSVQNTSLSGLDRVLGLAIGLARGVVMLGGFILLLNAATPPERMPKWITGAKLFPVASAAGKALRAFAPRGMKIAREVAPDLAGSPSALIGARGNGDSGDQPTTEDRPEDSR